MKWCLLIVILLANTANAQDKKRYLFTAGLNYRQHPIDIEDVPRGGVSSPNTNFYGFEFWQTWSFNAQTGIELNRNWIISLEGHTRYNQLHYTEGYNRISDSVTTYSHRSYKKNFKCDAFITVERIIGNNKSLDGNLFVNAGIGLLNMNTRYDVTLQDTSYGSPLDPVHYSGNLMQVSPKVSVGYQYKFFRFSVDTYLIEDPAMMDLASLWFGGTISFQFAWHRTTK